MWCVCALDHQKSVGGDVCRHQEPQKSNTCTHKHDMNKGTQCFSFDTNQGPRAMVGHGDAENPQPMEGVMSSTRPLVMLLCPISYRL